MLWQEQSVHRALEADMQFADLAFGQSNDFDPCKLQMFEQGGDVCLIAADAVQRFGQHDSEFAALRVLQESLDAGRAAGSCSIRRCLRLCKR